MKRVPKGHALVTIEDLAELHRRANRSTRPRLVVETAGHLKLLDVGVAEGQATKFDLPGDLKLTIFVPA